MIDSEIKKKKKEEEKMRENWDYVDEKMNNWDASYKMNERFLRRKSIWLIEINEVNMIWITRW